MTLIPNLPAIVTVSGGDLLPINDVSEQKTKRVSVAQLITSAGGAVVGIDPQTVNSAGATITGPALGKIKLVNLNVAADTLYTGLPAPSGSGDIYVLKQKQEFAASFSVEIDGIAAGETLLSGAGSRIMIVDLGTYEAL